MISDDALRRVLPRSAVELLGDLIRWSLWGLVFIVWAAFLQVYVRMFRLTLADPSHSDFTIFYYTARLMADGLPMYGESPARYGISWAADHLGNLNPPHLQLIALPLARLSYEHALVVWVLVNLVCLLASITLVARELGIRWLWSRFCLWGSLTISSAAFTTVAVTSELTFVLMVPLTLAWIAWRRERWVSAGVLLGMCASVKLFLLLFTPWLLWRRQWKCAACFAAGFAALVSVGAAILGIGAYRQWLATLGRVGWWWLPMNASWQGVASRLLQGSPKVAALMPHPEWLAVAGAAGAIVIAVFTIALAGRPERVDPDRSFLVLLAGAVLSSPLGWVYYLPLGFGPILGWMDAASGWRRFTMQPLTTRALLLAGIALLYVPHESTFAGQPSGLASVTIASVYFWGLLSIWGAALVAKSS